MKKQNGIINMIALLLVALVIIVVFFFYVFFLRDIISSSEVPVVDNTTEAGEVKNEVEEPVVKPGPDKQKIAYTDFDYKFLKLEAEEDKNLVYSPLSIKSALKMLVEGANGETKTELDNLLDGVDLNHYQSVGEQLSFVNGIYIRKEFKDSMKKEYVDLLRTKYEAEVKYDDFKSPDAINKWIEDNTFGIIKNLLRQDQIDEAELLLINALAIDMRFKAPFDDNNTHGREFKKADGSKAEVAMMNETFYSDDVLYVDNKDEIAFVTKLEELYDANLEFMAVMPKKESLNEYAANFDKNKLEAIDKELKEASKEKAGVNVSIPRFDFEYSLKLKQDLLDLGVKLAFDEEFADFSKMADEPLHVDDAIHKADFKFSEKGVKAAAVTVIIMMKNTAIIAEPEEPVVLNFDKPFMFFIRDREKNDIWFVGTMYEPDLWENVKTEYEAKY